MLTDVAVVQPFQNLNIIISLFKPTLNFQAGRPDRIPGVRWPRL